MKRRKIKKETGSRPFTLLEIMIALAVMSLVAGVCGWGIQSIVAEYQYRKGYTTLLSDLQKSHLLALANQTDLELKLWCEGSKVIYQFRSDDPIATFSSKPHTLSGVTQMKEKEKTLTALLIPLYSTGRIGDHPQMISFLKKNGEGFILHLETPHLFKIEPRSSHAHYKS